MRSPVAVDFCSAATRSTERLATRVAFHRGSVCARLASGGAEFGGASSTAGPVGASVLSSNESMDGRRPTTPATVSTYGTPARLGSPSDRIYEQSPETLTVVAHPIVARRCFERTPGDVRRGNSRRGPGVVPTLGATSPSSIGIPSLPTQRMTRPSTRRIGGTLTPQATRRWARWFDRLEGWS